VQRFFASFKISKGSLCFWSSDGIWWHHIVEIIANSDIEPGNNHLDLGKKYRGRKNREREKCSEREGYVSLLCLLTDFPILYTYTILEWTIRSISYCRFYIIRMYDTFPSIAHSVYAKLRTKVLSTPQQDWYNTSLSEVYRPDASNISWYRYVCLKPLSEISVGQSLAPTRCTTRTQHWNIYKKRNHRSYVTSSKQDRISEKDEELYVNGVGGRIGMLYSIERVKRGM